MGGGCLAKSKACDVLCLGEVASLFDFWPLVVGLKRAILSMGFGPQQSSPKRQDLFPPMFWTAKLSGGGAWRLDFWFLTTNPKKQGEQTAQGWGWVVAVVVVVMLVGRLWFRVRYEANLSMKFDQATAGVAAASATGTPDGKILGASGRKPTGTSLQNQTEHLCHVCIFSGELPWFGCKKRGRDERPVLGDIRVVTIICPFAGGP